MNVTLIPSLLFVHLEYVETNASHLGSRVQQLIVLEHTNNLWSSAVNKCPLLPHWTSHSIRANIADWYLLTH